MTAKEKAIILLSEMLKDTPPIKIEKVLNGGVSYKRFPKKKKDGSMRWLNEPNEDLKELQRSILKDLLYKFPVHPILCGFVPKKQMKEGVGSHILKRLERESTFTKEWLVKIDLKDFFPAIRSGVLFKMFEDIFSATLADNGVKEYEVLQKFCEIITKIVTFKGRLIQGAPTSPYLANLLLTWSDLIYQLEEHCQENAETISVYADDIAITSERKISKKKLYRIIKENGYFSINYKKTIINLSRHSSHKITGISIHDQRRNYNSPKTRLTLPTKKQKFYRGRIWQATCLIKRGIIPEEDEDGFSLYQIEGYISWIKHVCGEDIPSSLNKVVSTFENEYLKFKYKNLMG